MARSELAGEAIRYGISGVMLATLYSAVYWSLAELAGIPVLVANTIAFGVNLIAGWAIHSRWSFAGHRLAENQAHAYAGFFLINLASYGLNSLWVWLIVDRFHQSVALSIVPVVTLTPAITFLLNRYFVFRRRL